MTKSKAPATATAREKQSSISTSTLSSLQSNLDIWYKIQTLLYDLCNIASDRAAEAHSLATTDELYISGPYFSPEEAMIVKATLVSRPLLNEIPEFEALCMDNPNEFDESKEVPIPPIPKIMTIEVAIKFCLKISSKSAGRAVMLDHVDPMLWAQFIKQSLASRKKI